MKESLHCKKIISEMKLPAPSDGVSKDNPPVTFGDIPLIKRDKRELLFLCH